MHAVSIENILVVDVMPVLVWFWLYAYSYPGTCNQNFRTTTLTYGFSLFT